MKFKTLSLHPYNISLKTGQMRYGAFIEIVNSHGKSGLGEIAPLPKFSRETLEDACTEIASKKKAILRIKWDRQTWQEELIQLKLLPSVAFGLESAILNLLDPLPKLPHTTISALLMGTPSEILQQADLRKQEGFKSAKLKVNNLSFQEAKQVIDRLKDDFRLRIDVNRAWKTEDALRFFSEFSTDAFDYVEEPFQNPRDLGVFSHPLAVDESFPHDLALEDLETLPKLKALVYKPTVQGGIAHCLPIKAWCEKRGVELVLSSSFESPIGLSDITSMAYRLKLHAPVGLGTYYFFRQ